VCSVLRSCRQRLQQAFQDARQREGKEGHERYWCVLVLAHSIGRGASELCGVSSRATFIRAALTSSSRSSCGGVWDAATCASSRLRGVRGRHRRERVSARPRGTPRGCAPSPYLVHWGGLPGVEKKKQPTPCENKCQNKNYAPLRRTAVRPGVPSKQARAASCVT